MVNRLLDGCLTYLTQRAECGAQYKNVRRTATARRVGVRLIGNFILFAAISETFALSHCREQTSH